MPHLSKYRFLSGKPTGIFWKKKIQKFREIPVGRQSKKAPLWPLGVYAGISKLRQISMEVTMTQSQIHPRCTLWSRVVSKYQDSLSRNQISNWHQRCAFLWAFSVGHHLAGAHSTWLLENTDCGPHLLQTDLHVCSPWQLYDVHPCCWLTYLSNNNLHNISEVFTLWVR